MRTGEHSPALIDCCDHQWLNDSTGPAIRSRQVVFDSSTDIVSRAIVWMAVDSFFFALPCTSRIGGETCGVTTIQTACSETTAAQCVSAPSTRTITRGNRGPEMACRAG